MRNIQNKTIVNESTYLAGGLDPDYLKKPSKAKTDGGNWWKTNSLAYNENLLFLRI